MFSATPAPAVDVITGATSLTFVTPMVNTCVTDEPSVDVARTTIAWLAAVSKSSAPATVTTPVLASMANRPPASLSSEYVTVSVASGIGGKRRHADGGADRGILGDGVRRTVRVNVGISTGPI